MKKETSIMELAKNLVGDGKSPNKYFVTIAYGWYLPANDEADAIQVENSLDCVTVLFTDKQNAINFYESVLTYQYEGKITPETISQVILEDRKTGVIMDKILKARTTTGYYIYHTQ